MIYSGSAGEEQPRWIALQTKPNCEASASALLEQKGYEQFLPRYRTFRRRGGQTTVTEVPLFRRYLFCRCQWTSHHLSPGAAPVLTTPGILRPVSFGSGPAPIDDEEIEAIRRLLDPVLCATPWPHLRKGQTVKIVSGPLKGLQGLLVSERGEHRFVVSITLLQRSASVVIDREWLEPLQSENEAVRALIDGAAAAK